MVRRLPIILDLCGGTGAWSKPYRDSGLYDVRLITLPDHDVRYYHPTKHVHGILAAPPCTDFCISGAVWWATKDISKGLLEGLSIVAACLRIIRDSKSAWWALENPVGRLRRFIGPPKFIFQPYEFGDPWTKRTCLWGEFTIPEKKSVEPIGGMVVQGSGFKQGQHEIRFLRPDLIHKLGPSKERSTLRSITPPNFARAFYEANP